MSLMVVENKDLFYFDSLSNSNSNSKGGRDAIKTNLEESWNMPRLRHCFNVVVKDWIIQDLGCDVEVDNIPVYDLNAKLTVVGSFALVVIDILLQNTSLLANLGIIYSTSLLWLINFFNPEKNEKKADEEEKEAKKERSKEKSKILYKMVNRISLGIVRTLGIGKFN